MSRNPFLDPFAVIIDSSPPSGVVLLKLSGVLDEFSVAELRRVVAAVYDGPAHSVVLDLSAVPLIDSDGFGALINIQKRLTEMRRRLALVGCQEAVRLALSLTRLEVLLPCYPTLRDVPRVVKT